VLVTHNHIAGSVQTNRLFFRHCVSLSRLTR